MFQMLGVFAEFERAMIQERVRAGLARAKAEGKRLGRPTLDPITEDAIREALRRENRPGILKIAKEFGRRNFDGATDRCGRRRVSIIQWHLMLNLVNILIGCCLV
jgi:DNA invertase Pin-like site-specific DNA recombinase